MRWSVGGKRTTTMGEWHVEGRVPDDIAEQLSLLVRELPWLYVKVTRMPDPNHTAPPMYTVSVAGPPVSIIGPPYTSISGPFDPRGVTSFLLGVLALGRGVSPWMNRSADVTPER